MVRSQLPTPSLTELHSSPYFLIWSYSYHVPIIFFFSRLSVLRLQTTQSLRATYLQEDAFFANEHERDCVDRGIHSCKRISHCVLRVDDNGNFDSCLEKVHSCDKIQSSFICNDAVDRNKRLCRFVGRSSNGRCVSTSTRVTIRPSEAEDYVDYEEDVTDSSEDMPSDSEDYDFDYDYEDEEGEDFEDMFSTSEDYSDSY